jgi:hypothetical protein
VKTIAAKGWVIETSPSLRVSTDRPGRSVGRALVLELPNGLSERAAHEECRPSRTAFSDDERFIGLDCAGSSGGTQRRYGSMCRVVGGCVRISRRPPAPRSCRAWRRGPVAVSRVILPRPSSLVCWPSILKSRAPDWVENFFPRLPQRAGQSVPVMGLPFTAHLACGVSHSRSGAWMIAASCS